MPRHPMSGASAEDPLPRIMAAVDGARPRCGVVRVVAIDGRSGAGKTTLAKRLGEALGASVLHLDDLYPGWDGLAASVGQLTTQVLEPLARGQRAAYRRWDWERDVPADWAPVTLRGERPILVIDGVGSAVPPAEQYAAVRVFVEAPESLRRARGIARDGESYAANWERWAAQERELFARHPVDGRYDIVVSTDPERGPEADRDDGPVPARALDTSRAQPPQD